MRISKPSVAGLFVVVLIVAIISPALSASSPHPASDLLGQLGENNSPIYTTSGANDVGNARGFDQPISATLDLVHHRLFVSESNNSRVLVFNLDSSNNLIDRVADNVLGQPDMKTVASTTTQVGMRRPRSLSYDAVNNRLFVGDRFNHRILIFDLSSGITNGMAASYVLGQPDFTSANATTTQSGMQFPSDSFFDSATNRLFITDTNNNRLLIFDLSSGVTNGMPASYVLGQIGFASSTAITTSTSLRNPAQMAYDSALQRLFVADATSNRVVVYLLSGGVTSTMAASFVLGQTTFTGSGSGVTSSTMSFPSGLIYDASNTRLFVSDFSNNRILTFNVASGTLANGMSATNVLGQLTFASNTATTTQYAARSVGSMAYDPANGLLYAPEQNNNRLMIFDVASITDGENAVNALGQLDGSDNPVYTINTANNTPNNRGFNLSNYSEIDTVHHRLFASDFNNYRVLVFNLDSNNNLVDRVADNVLGQPDMRSNAAPTTATAGNMYNPQGLAYDADNDRLFVADANQNRVLVFDTASIVNGESAVNVIGQTTMASSTFGTTSSTLKTPYSVEYDRSHQRLFVNDFNNNRILVFDTSSGITNGMAASYVLGQATFTSGTAATTQAGLYAPEEIFYDSASERLFVAEFQNKRVVVFDVNPATIANGENASFVLGQPDFNTSSTGVTQSKMSGATGVAYDAANQRLFASDYSNNRVLVFDLSSGITNGMNASAVLGQLTFASSTGATTQGGLRNPWGLYFDSTTGRLYVGDTTNNRIMIYGPFSFSLSPSSLPWGQVGQSYSQTLSASGFSETPAYTLASGTLPPGLTLSSGGILSGSPTMPGGYTFTLAATDNAGGTGSNFSASRSYPMDITNAGGYSGGSSGGGLFPPSSSTIVQNPPVGYGVPVTSSPATTTAPYVYQSGELAPAGCAPYLTKYIIPGRTNDAASVARLQKFLSQSENIPLLESGFYDTSTQAALIRFQEKYADRILAPWGEVQGTGFMYLTTARKINEIVCGVNAAFTDPKLLIPYSKLVGAGFLQTTPLAVLSAPVVPAAALPSPEEQKTLYVGQQGPVILKLQKFLNEKGFTVAKSGPGSPGQETDRFGAATWAAVARFQEYYAKDILTPAGLTWGNGVVGPRTWAKLLDLGW